MFFGDVNEATARVLAAEGCEVIVPQTQGCCGALAEHAGEEADAMAAARTLIDAFDAHGRRHDRHQRRRLRLGDEAIRPSAAQRPGVRANAPGVRREVQGHFRSAGRARAARAARRGSTEARAYHDACHLQHAQGVRAQPRRLLQAIPGVELREIAESEICCGSAGIYNLLEPEAATQLRDRKVQNILRTDADVIVSGNPGCLLQIATGLDAAGRPMRIMHLVEVLDQSIREAEIGCNRCMSAQSGDRDRCFVGAAILPDNRRLGLHDSECRSAMSASMPMPGGWSMSMAWMSMGRQSLVAHAAMFLVMWTVMMIAMMLPSVMPAVLLHRRLIQARARARRRRLRIAPASARRIFFASGLAFGAVAYAIGMTLASAAMRSIRVSVLVPAATGWRSRPPGRIS